MTTTLTVFPQLHSDGDGLELRDYFAAQALAGMFACLQLDPTAEGQDESHAQMARTAYSIADAMLVAREET